MRYLKTFENYEIDCQENKPHQFDYIICNAYDLDFVSNSIGQIITFKFLNGASEQFYYVEYKNVPEDIDHYFHDEYGARCLVLIEDEIEYWSKDKEYLEEMLRTKKYNV